MLTRVRTSTLSGIEAISVDVEVEVRGGTERFIIIGLGDSAVRESRDRVTAAIKHSGFVLPEQILVNLAPAEVKKEGAAFDLPIAVAILAASKQLSIANPDAVCLHGELSLDGRLKPVRGALAFALEARERQVPEIIVPALNGSEASLIKGIRVRTAHNLFEVASHFRGKPLPIRTHEEPRPTTIPTKSLAEVWGQSMAKRAMLIAAAGGHNLMLIGPPGCGKSMLAERMPSLLPPLSESEIVDAVRIHSVAGAAVSEILSGQRPFRCPHHVISDAGLIGGGAIPKPGEISLAHHGVLFLDEFPEFRRSALEALRAPLESGRVQISRARASLTLPSRFQLIAAMNPCPCGRLGARGQTCTCSRAAILSYLKKLSGPILDRIDLHVELAPVELATLGKDQSASDSDATADLQLEVLRAKDIQLARQGRGNSELSGQELTAQLAGEAALLRMLEQACQKRGLSARAYVRILRVARTIADLDRSAKIAGPHIAEALGYRSLERIERFCLAA